jgi:hypothetical protein
MRRIDGQLLQGRQRLARLLFVLTVLKDMPHPAQKSA